MNKASRKWSELRNDYCNNEGYITIDAWETCNDNEEGKVIAMVNTRDGSVAYIDNLARVDMYAQEIIKETVAKVLSKCK